VDLADDGTAMAVHAADGDHRSAGDVTACVGESCVGGSAGCSAGEECSAVDLDESTAIRSVDVSAGAGYRADEGTAIAVAAGIAVTVAVSIAAESSIAAAVSVGGHDQPAWLKLLALGRETESEPVDIHKLLAEATQDIVKSLAGLRWGPGARFRDKGEAQGAVDALCALFTLPPIKPKPSNGEDKASGFIWKCDRATKEPLLKRFIGGRDDGWALCPFRVRIVQVFDSPLHPAGSWSVSSSETILCHFCV